jgi:lon-related putative ATP-dependent protease
VTPAKPLRPEDLRPACDPSRFSFATTADLPDPEALPGQARALDALVFGAGMRQEGYHVFAQGPADTGRRALVTEALRRRAASEPVPDDIGYLHNFEQPWRPRALRLPAGRLRGLRADLERLVEDLRTVVPAALEGEATRARKQVIEDELKERQEQAFESVREEGAKHGIRVVRTPLGIAFAPEKDGEVLPSEEFEKLPAEERAAIAHRIELLQERLRHMVESMQDAAREARDKIKALVRDLVSTAVGGPIRALRDRWAEFPAVLAHLDAVEHDAIENVSDFLKSPEGGTPALPSGLAPDGGTPPAPGRRYLVNVLVDHDGEKGAPVVVTDHPTVPHLIGRVEHVAQLGAHVTDFHLIKPGDLHRADGGYLVVDTQDLFSQPYAYEALKRALRTREARIESLGQMLSLVSTVSLEPQPLPLDVKVVLTGERLVFALLDAYDPEFRETFKVAADFEEDFDRTPEGETLYARFAAAVGRRDGLLPLTPGGAARFVEQGSRLAEDATKLSARFARMADLLREADWHGRAAGRAAIEAADLDRAHEEAERRMGRIRERLLEETVRGTLRIDTSGTAVGQVNGLAVLRPGRLAFGRPTRISARVRLGRGEVVDVERQVELSGPIHSKGVMILSSFLSARYATDHPLSLSATLVFEQSYDRVDGDSASAAELFALLSALAEVPLRQDLAVTGSVDQHGRIQPVGGVNEKIEGFFDLCAAQGLSGTQGVVLPASNARHLVLAPRVVEAARAGRFHVSTITTVDEGLEALTGRPAGARGADGRFPEGSINRLVEDRLVALARRRIELGRLSDRAAGHGASHPSPEEPA